MPGAIDALVALSAVLLSLLALFSSDVSDDVEQSDEAGEDDGGSFFPVLQPDQISM